jgi:hypothetical protein
MIMLDLIYQELLRLRESLAQRDGSGTDGTAPLPERPDIIPGQPAVTDPTPGSGSSCQSLGTC